MSFYLGVMVWGKPPDNYSIYLPIICSIGLLITLGLRALYHYMWESDAGRRIVAIFAASYLAGLLWMSARATIFYQIFEDQRKTHEKDGMELFSYFDGAMSAFWVMLVWSCLYFGIKYYMLLLEEIEALKLYLDIEEVRFDERLKLHFNVGPGAETALMPSLLLQPLVVADDGPGLDLKHGRMPKGGGVGVSNCRERLKELYHDKQSFRLSTTDPHGLTISIRIPLSRRPE